MPTKTRELPSKKDFFKGLRKEVFSFLTENKIKQIDQKGLLIKALVSYSLWFVSYFAYLFVGYYFSWYALLLIVPAGFSLLCIVLGVMHDGSHGSFSESKVLNKIAALSLGFAGASSQIWYESHVRAHHDNTNVIHYDQDFESGGLLRLHPSQEKKSAYRFQHLYAWLLYLGFALRWILFDDVQDLITNRCKFSRSERIKLFFEILIVKVWHIGVFFVLPAWLIGWQIALVFYLIHWTTLSISLLLVFAMAHLSKVQEMPAEKGAYSDWALHQLATTVNFSANNKFLSWVVGGLNFQIEHHIFPKMSHTRYPLIRGVVKNYCQNRGVAYVEFPTFFSVIKAHYQHLKFYGQP